MMQQPPSVAPSLAPDCDRCAALCCVALHVEKSSKFAIDKPAGVACPNLAQTGKCCIHASLSERGFSGCIAYDCLGAGQKVVQELYDGNSWQQNQSLLAPMSEDFAKMRIIHALLEVLTTAEILDLAPPQEAKRQSLIARLSPQSGWNRELFEGFDTESNSRDVNAFLSTLRPLLDNS